jgi:hypothetical protein
LEGEKVFKPLFNTVLVEIKEDKWARASGNDDNIGGEVFREGKVISFGSLAPDSDHPVYLVNGLAQQLCDDLDRLAEKTVIWNEGHEAGTVFEEDGKKYALLYWWDLRGVKDDK